MAAILGLARQIVELDFVGSSLAALDASGHPADLRALASRNGLLNPDPDKRTTLAQVLSMCPLEEEEEEEEDEASMLPLPLVDPRDELGGEGERLVEPPPQQPTGNGDSDPSEYPGELT